jgi:tetratricopeptide (TPR) repeat protein
VFARFGGVWGNALAIAHAGHHEEALAAFAYVIAESERCGDVLFPMRVLNCIGWVYGEIENHERALEQNLRGVEAAMAVDLPDPEVEMNARLNAADNLIALGRFDEAAEHLQSVERVVRDPLPPERWMLWRYSQHYYHTKGELHLIRGDAETAMMLAERCLSLADETSSRKNIVKARRLRGQARIALGDLAAAETDITAALELAIEIGNPGQLWKTHEALGALRGAQGRADDAKAAYGDALAVVARVAASLADDQLRDTLLGSAVVGRLQERVRNS